MGEWRVERGFCKLNFSRFSRPSDSAPALRVNTTVVDACRQSRPAAAWHTLCSPPALFDHQLVHCPPVNIGYFGEASMAQMKTYSRKARLIDSSQGAYKSSQESFFDSPDDPYCFDSQHSACHDPQQSMDDRSTLLSSSSDRSATGAFSSHSQLPSMLPIASGVSKAAAPLPNTHARLASQAQPAPSAKHLNAKQAQSASLSRLSQSSSVGAKPASALPAKQLKRSSAALCPAAATVEGPAPKKARLKHSSSSSTNQARNSGSSSGRDKPQQAPATTVLEVTVTWVTHCSTPSINMQASLSSLVCRHKKAGNTHRLLMT